MRKHGNLSVVANNAQCKPVLKLLWVSNRIYTLSVKTDIQFCCALFWCDYILVFLPFEPMRFTNLYVLGMQCDCLSVSEVILKDMDKIHGYQITQQNTMKHETCAYFSVKCIYHISNK